MSRYPSEPPADWPPSAEEAMAGYPSMPDYPPVAGHPAEAGYQAAPGSSVAPGTPAIAHDEYGEDQYDPPPAQYAEEHHELAPAGDEDHHGLASDEFGVVYDEYGQVHEAAAGELSEPYPLPADLDPGPATALRSAGSAARMAMLAYLTVPLFGFVVPLVVYVRARVQLDPGARGPGPERLDHRGPVQPVGRDHGHDAGARLTADRPHRVRPAGRGIVAGHDRPAGPGGHRGEPGRGVHLPGLALLTDRALTARPTSASP